MSGDNSVIPTSKVVMEMQFDLIRNCVEGEEPPSEDQMKESADVLSLWKQYITDKIKIQVSEKEYDTLRLVEHSQWFKQLEYHIILVSNANATRKDIFNALVHLIGLTIFKFTRILCDLKIKMNPETFIVYIQNVKLTEKNTIDFENTALFLIENTSLHTEYKYMIACYFCLKKQVRELLKELPFQYFESFIDSSNEIHHLLAVWYYCGTNQWHLLNKLMDRCNGKSYRTNDEYFMLWAITHENELAVQYVYEKFCKIRCPNSIYRFAQYALNYKSTNILCYLLSKLPSEDQIKCICINYGSSVLSMLETDSRWSDYLMPTSDYVLKYFDKMTFPCGIKTLIRCWMVNESRRKSYGKYLDSFSSKHKVFIDEHLLHTRNMSILKVILELQKMKSIVPLLKLGSVLEFDDFCKDDDIIGNIGFELITEDKIPLLEELLSDIYPEVEKKQVFKCFLFEILHFKVCSSFIKVGRFKELDDILHYFCEQNEEILNVKENILFKEDGQIIASVFEIEDATVWEVITLANEILSWSFNGDERRFDLCKYELLNPFIDPISYCMKQFLILMGKLMMKMGGESVNILLNWANPRHDGEWRENVLYHATQLARERNVVNI